MKSFVLSVFIAVVLGPAGSDPAAAQENGEGPRLYKEGSLSFSRIADRPCFFIDARVGWRYAGMIDIGAHLLTQVTEVTSPRIDDDNLQVSLLGIHAGIFRETGSGVEAAVHLGAGFGYSGFTSGGTLPGNPDLIGYAEPAASLSLTIMEGLSLGARVGYRQVFGVNRQGCDNADFSGVTISLFAATDGMFPVIF